jgi:hypothetical protein
VRAEPGDTTIEILAIATIVPMAERAAVERELEEIGTQLAWVRDYL